MSYFGGERGIRTLGEFNPTHDFQSCALDQLSHLSKLNCRACPGYPAKATRLLYSITNMKSSYIPAANSIFLRYLQQIIYALKQAQEQGTKGLQRLICLAEYFPVNNINIIKIIRRGRNVIPCHSRKVFIRIPFGKHLGVF